MLRASLTAPARSPHHRTPSTTMYANMSNKADFTDVASGFCGPYVEFNSVAGWDFCTGIGIPYGYVAK
jgi:hypothetical protein